jgi:hypothetical protein
MLGAAMLFPVPPTRNNGEYKALALQIPPYGRNDNKKHCCPTTTPRPGTMLAAWFPFLSLCVRRGVPLQTVRSTQYAARSALSSQSGTVVASIAEKQCKGAKP